MRRLALLSILCLLLASGAGSVRAASGSLPAVTSGPRPGPAVLYEPLATAPELTNGPGWSAAPLLVSGAQAYAAGEYLYQDYVYDSYGANTTDVPLAQPDTVPSSTDTLFGGATGDVVYPTDVATYAHDAADLLEFRARLQDGKVVYRVTLTTMVDASAAAVAIGIDSAPGGTDDWGSGIGSLGDLNLDHVLVASSSGATLDGAPVASTVNPATNQIEIVTPLAPGGAAWRHYVAVGLWNASTGTFKQIQQQPTATMPGGAQGTTPPPIFNVGFRFNEPAVRGDAAGTVADPLANKGARTTAAGSWREHAQALALGARDISAMGATIDFAKIAAGTTDFSGVPTTGFISRLYASRLDLGEGARPDRPMLRGKIQPYGLYVPTTYDPNVPAPFTLALHSLSCSYNQFAVLAPNLYRDLGEDRGAIVLTAEGRGPDGWYHDEAEYDLFEAWNDVSHKYSLDASRVAVNGYSMGGYATLRLSTTWPDLFNAGFGVVAPGDENILGAPTNGYVDDQGTLDLLGNTRSVPLKLWYGANDELVPVVGALNVANALRSADVVHEVDVFPGFDHFAHSLLDEWDPGAAWLTSKPPIDLSPSRVVFTAKPALDNAALGLVHDHAYWVSDVRVLGSQETGFVDALSLGRGHVELKTAATIPAGADPAPHVKSGLAYAGHKVVSPAADELRLTLGGVTSLTIDIERAGLPATFQLVADAAVPFTVTFTGYGRSVTMSGLTNGSFSVTV